MSEGLRVLVASPLGEVVAAPLRSRFPDWTVEVATDDTDFVRRVAGRVRFDVVTADLVWNRPDTEWAFDGLDVIELLRAHDRLAPVLLAAQGHSMEVDLIEEASRRDEVVGVVAKSDGFAAFADAIRVAALGRSLPPIPSPGRRPSLYELFSGRRGQTAGRMAGAIAAGHVSDTASLARVAKVSPNTANKITSHYLGPMIIQRGEHDEHLPMTQASVYRWSGLHARYLMSWCRRNGHADVLTA
ncbi:response regulator [Gordonia sp. DT30]|uniref:response regulator n=1 Tax=unclassified Gordonia (in: high G+C Gram-positive bacteria) TaxID=2657482 RepID=UPI003CFA9FAA